MQGLLLTGCRQLTDAGMMPLLRALPALTLLDVSGCLALTDAYVCIVSACHLWRAQRVCKCDA
ncbi:MAG: hypothetical protein EOO41_03785 [Methanobacteriota archaeon]|nr:MAG: hypothetical protein EOO41_03785 [Euryarchaeota archaeon]